MKISDEKTLLELQEEFNGKFPYLKIEFYKKAHGVNESSRKKDQLDLSKTIGEVRTIHIEGDLSTDGHQKVSTLERHFLDNYGLSAQVFRKSGNIWLQTSATDNWTLADQNRKGAEDAGKKF